MKKLITRFALAGGLLTTAPTFAQEQSLRSLEDKLGPACEDLTSVEGAKNCMGIAVPLTLKYMGDVTQGLNKVGIDAVIEGYSVAFEDLANGFTTTGNIRYIRNLRDLMARIDDDKAAMRDKCYVPLQGKELNFCGITLVEQSQILGDKIRYCSTEMADIYQSYQRGRFSGTFRARAEYVDQLHEISLKLEKTQTLGGDQAAKGPKKFECQ